MKKILFFLFVAGVCAGPCMAQQAADADVSALQTLLQQASGSTASVSVKPLPATYALQLENNVVPLAETTHLAWRKDRKNSFLVEFFLQQGTAVTDVTNPAFRRAYWKIDFPSKQACQEFIKRFDNLRNNLKKA